MEYESLLVFYYSRQMDKMDKMDGNAKFLLIRSMNE